MNRAVFTLISVTVAAMILTATNGCTDQMLPAEGGTPTNGNSASTIVYTSLEERVGQDVLGLVSTNQDGTVRRNMRDGQIMGEPAGGKALFVSKIGDATYVLNITTIGKNDSTLIYAGTSEEDFEHFSAAISPDGRKVAFATDEDGAGSPDIHQLYVCNADGTGRTPLGQGLAHNSHITFSDDGLRIAYYGDEVSFSGRSVYVVSVFGGRPFKVADNADGGFDGSSWLDFSPDGSKIVYTAAGPDDNRPEIAVVNIDGSGRVNLTNDVYADYMPSFSPDGSKIVWCGGGVVEIDIHVMNADGTGRMNLTGSYNEGMYQYPQWSPDSKKILYTVYPGEPDKTVGQLKMIDIGTSVVTTVANSVYRGFWIK